MKCNVRNQHRLDSLVGASVRSGSCSPPERRRDGWSRTGNDLSGPGGSCSPPERRRDGPEGLADAINLPHESGNSSLAAGDRSHGGRTPLAPHRKASAFPGDTPSRLRCEDEAQGIGSLVVPKSSTVFGERDGKPLVDLSGRYEGGINKSHIFRRCYRTPELLLMAAHAVNMGLLRREGPLHGITTQEERLQLGYEVQGSFAKLGEPVRLRRHPDVRRHRVDADAELRKRAGEFLLVRPFDDEAAERKWIAEEVARDVRNGLRPEDILITGVVGAGDRDHFNDLVRRLGEGGIGAWQPGVDPSSIVFRRDGCVTVADVFRAKVNEGWKVYASRMHYATRPLAWRQETEVHKRNQAFVTLTRARIWCVATGLSSSPVLEELRQAQSMAPELVFPAFNRAMLRRIMDEAEG